MTKIQEFGRMIRDAELTEPPADKLTRAEVDDAVWMIAQLTKLLWRDGKPRAMAPWVRMAVMDALDTITNELET